MLLLVTRYTLVYSIYNFVCTYMFFSKNKITKESISFGDSHNDLHSRASDRCEKGACYNYHCNISNSTLIQTV